jgi:hypothetical protein
MNPCDCPGQQSSALVRAVVHIMLPMVAAPMLTDAATEWRVVAKQLVDCAQRIAASSGPKHPDLATSASETRQMSHVVQ